MFQPHILKSVINSQQQRHLQQQHSQKQNVAQPGKNMLSQNHKNYQGYQLESMNNEISLPHFLQRPEITKGQPKSFHKDQTLYNYSK